MSQTVPSHLPTSVVGAVTPPPPPRPAGLTGSLRPPVEADEIGRLANYRVLRLLAEGGMGKVFLAEDVALRRPVALKVIQPNLERTLPGAWERFLREARAMASIRHDNLVTVYAAGEDNDTVYLAMELLRGETLEQRLDRDGPLPPEELVRVGRELAAGLAAVHAGGLIHRDIKPANLWLEEPGGRVKILDFGLVRAAEGETGLTEIGMIVGTPAYLSPEQVRGEAFDHRADLFSLGCVLYRMCTNRVPFPAKTAMGQLTAVAVDEAAPIRNVNPAVPPAFAGLVMQLLDKDPDRRPPSATAVADRLARAGDVSAPAKRGRTGAKKRVRGETTARIRHAATPAPGGRRWLWAAGAVAVVGALVAAGVVAFRKPERTVRPDAPAAAAAGGQTPLADLTPSAKTIAFRGPPPPGTLGPIVVRGRTVGHGIFMHGAHPHEGATTITYRPGRQYTKLTGSVAFTDSAPPVPPAATFTVYADGKVVWRSRELQRRDDTDSFDLPVSGVESVTLELQSRGDPRGCHTAWVDPLLTK